MPDGPTDGISGLWDEGPDEVERMVDGVAAA
jgi:hypothetical protein